jgi:hypothetical protein
MKMRLLLALVGLAISFAGPAFAQEKDTVDPQIAEQVRALASKYDQAFNKSEFRKLLQEFEVYLGRIFCENTFAPFVFVRTVTSYSMNLQCG